MALTAWDARLRGIVTVEPELEQADPVEDEANVIPLVRNTAR